MSKLTLRANGTELRVMSSNILFEKCLVDRVPLIADYYRDCAADVIGMQEVNRVGTALFDILADGYTAVAKTHADGKHCFTPILYRHDRFALVEGGSELHRMRATDTKSFSYAVLEDKETGKKFAVLNTHSAIILACHKLEASNAVEGEQWRGDNVLQMLEKRDELYQKYGQDLPVLITGDFNAVPTGDSITTMKQHMHDSADVATLSNEKNVCSYHGRPGTPCRLEGCGPIDFIFVNDTVKVLTHNVPHDEAAIAISDHCPVYIDATLN